MSEPIRSRTDSSSVPGTGRGRTRLLVLATLLIVGAVYVLLLFVGTSRGTRQEAGLGAVTQNALAQALSSMPVLPRLKERMNILVLGVDWNGDDAERYSGTRSDTIMVVSLDPEKGKVGVVSIPRDSLVDVARGRGPNKINSAHAAGGPKLTIATIEQNFGIHIDSYVVVDTEGLTDIFELLGPFEVVVEKHMRYVDHTANLDIDLHPGKQELDASQLIGYLRFRHDATADIGRMERQQWFLRQALAKAKDPAILLRAPQLIQLAYDCVKTDLSVEEIASILSFTRDLTSGDIVTATLPGHGETIEGINYYVLSNRGARAIFTRLCSERIGSAKRWRAGRRKWKRERVRIAIKCSEPMEEYASELADTLKDKGWRVRHMVKAQHEDCQHAQLNLSSTRIDNKILVSLADDLPLLKDWPVVIKYGATLGSDIVLVLPDDGGMSSWYESDFHKARYDVPESRLPHALVSSRTETML